MGVYASSNKDNKSFNWLNPVSVGINDITPDDESSWAVRNNDINKILFEKINCHVPENYLPPYTMKSIRGLFFRGGIIKA